MPRGQSNGGAARNLIFISHRRGSGVGGATFNNKAGVGSPVGSSTPDYVGQSYLKTNSPLELWFATGLTAADWSQLI